MCASKVTPPLDANWGRWTTIGGAYRRLLRLGGRRLAAGATDAEWILAGHTNFGPHG
jgi:hypothetical protein